MPALTSRSDSPSATTTPAAPLTIAPCACARCGRARNSTRRTGAMAFHDDIIYLSMGGAVVRIRGFMSVIRASHERPRLDVDEAKIERNRLQLSKFVRMVVPDHRCVAGRRPEVLANGEDLTVDVAQVLEGLDQFLTFFAEPDHESRLRGNVG